MAEQATLFDQEQAPQIARVQSAIGGAVLAFCRHVMSHALNGDTSFRGDELRVWINKQGIDCAPASPDRILRALRRAGQLDYTIINRRQSLYRVTRVR